MEPGTPEFEDAVRRFTTLWWSNPDAQPEDVAGRDEQPALFLHLTRLTERLADERNRIGREFSAACQAARLAEVAAEYARISTDFADAIRHAGLPTAAYPEIREVLERECGPDDPPEKHALLFFDLLIRELRVRAGPGRRLFSSHYRAGFPASEHQHPISAAFDECHQAFAWRFRVLGSPARPGADWEIGTGGQAVVLVGHDDQLDRRIAIKRVRGDGGLAANGRLRREAWTLARLPDAGVPAVYGFGRDEQNRLCLAETLISRDRPPGPGQPDEVRSGQTFAERFDAFRAGPRPDCRRKNPAFLDVLAKLIAVCRTVAAAHRHPFGIVHRDLKPDNLLLDAEGQPFVIDWGLSVWANRDAVEALCDPPVAHDMTTASRAGVGTPGYMCPEQANPTTASPTADVFGLGACLFKLVSGHRVFDCLNPRWALGRTLVRPVKGSKERDELLRRTHHYRRVPNPRANRWRTDRELSDIIRRALDPDPARRYQHAGELAEALEDWIRDNPPRHSAGRWVDRRRYALGRWVRRHTRLFILFTLTAALLVGAAAAVWVWFLYARRAEAEASHARLNDFIQVVGEAPVAGPGGNRRSNGVIEARRRLDDFVAAADRSHSVLDHIHPDFADRVVDARLRVAEVCQSSGAFEDAAAALRPGVEALRERPDLRPRLAELYWKLGDIESDYKDYDTAIDDYDRAVEIWIADPGAGGEAHLPTLARFLGYRGDSHVKRALVRQRPADFALAEDDYRRSLALRRAVFAGRPADPNAAAELAHAYNNLARLGRLKREAGQDVLLGPILTANFQALVLQTHVVSWREADESRAAAAGARADLGNTLLDAADSLRLFGRRSLARFVYRMAHTELARAYQENPQVGTSLALAEVQLGQLDLLLTERTVDRPAVKELVALLGARFRAFHEFRVDDRYFRDLETRFLTLRQRAEGVR